MSINMKNRIANLATSNEDTALAEAGPSTPLVALQVRKASQSQEERSRQQGERTEQAQNQTYCIATSDINNAWCQEQLASIDAEMEHAIERWQRMRRKVMIFGGAIAEASETELKLTEDQSNDTAETIAQRFAAVPELPASLEVKPVKTQAEAQALPNPTKAHG